MISYLKNYIYTFSCGKCKAYWSITLSEDAQDIPEVMACPICMTIQKIESEVEND